jgi:hypothetical protein
MADHRNDYFIAVARNVRGQVPKNWLDIISAVEDVDVVNATDFRARIKATPSAVEQIRQRFKDALMVEEIINRKSL